MTSQSTDLFGTAESKPEPAMPPDWLNVVARKKLGQPPEWRWCKFQAIGDTDDCLIEGGIPRPRKSGKLKGLPTWKESVKSICVVTRAEMDQAKAAYELETGNCHSCAGSGQWYSGWSRETGSRFKSCPRCDATGKAPEVRP